MRPLEEDRTRKMLAKSFKDGRGAGCAPVINSKHVADLLRKICKARNINISTAHEQIGISKGTLWRLLTDGTLTNQNLVKIQRWANQFRKRS